GYGGGIHIDAGVISLERVRVTDNYGNFGVGGISNLGDLTIYDSDISNNHTPYEAGALWVWGQGTAKLVNTTISGNTADNAGGIALQQNANELTLEHVTIFNNTARWGGGGLKINGGTVSVQNTVVAGNNANTGPDILGTVVSLGNNLFQNTTGGSGFVSSDLVGIDPLLSAQLLDIGPTLAHIPKYGSPLIDAGSSTLHFKDQLGRLRNRDGNGNGVSQFDIGAFEVGQSPFAVIDDSYAGDDTRPIEAIDVNGDGTADLISASYINDRISVRLNDGSGFFGAAESYSSLDAVSGGLASADFDGDGYMDIVVAGERQTGKIAVSFSNGNGTFATKREITFDTTGGRHIGIVAVDLTSDGVPDVAVTDNYRDRLTTIKYDRQADTFSVIAQISTADQPNRLISSDVDGDNDNDLVVGSEAGILNVFLNDGSGNFSAGTHITTTGNIRELVAGDLNNDGVDDLVYVDTGSAGAIEIFLGDGSGGFINNVESIPLAAPFGESGLEIIDVDQDGLNDIVFLDGLAGQLNIYKNTGFNNGHTNFLHSFRTVIDTVGVGITAGDLNGDGVSDIVFATKSTDQHHTSTNKHYVMLNHAVNQDPNLDQPDNLTIDEDATEQTVNLTGITAGGGETQPLRVTASSNNTDLIANPSVIYTSAESTGSIKFTPLADQSGSAAITVTVEDGGLDNDLATTADNATITQTFDVTVNSVNDLPTLAAISDLAIDEDATEQTVNLTGITAG
ncbi:MAG: FG-GAP-like repeat-containing protein, partial [Pirellulales bacterium]